MKLFIHRLQISDEEKEKLRKHEKSVASLYGGPIFMSVGLIKYFELDNNTAIVVLAMWTFAASMQMVGDTRRYLITVIMLVITLSGALLAVAISEDFIRWTIAPGSVLVLLFAILRNRAGYVQRFGEK